MADADGTFRPVASTTDRTALASLSDAQIEDLAACDLDHPGLDIDALQKDGHA